MSGQAKSHKKYYFEDFIPETYGKPRARWSRRKR